MRINGAAYIVDISQSEAAARESAVAGSSESAGSDATSALSGRRSGALRGRSPDRVEISSANIELEKLKRDLAALPELRLDRVALAKQSLQDGGYRVAPGVLAQKMMEAFATH